MASVSAAYLELAGQSKAELAALFAAGTPPDVPALIGFEYRGFNQPKATALLGIRKFIKAFYLDRSGRPFGCNTPVVQNGLDREWIARPAPERPKRYAFFQVEPPDPEASDAERRAAALLDYGRGGNRAYDPSRMLRDYVVRAEPGSDDLLLGKAYFSIAGTRIAHTFFLIERYRALSDQETLRLRSPSWNGYPASAGVFGVTPDPRRRRMGTTCVVSTYHRRSDKNQICSGRTMAIRSEPCERTRR